MPNTIELHRVFCAPPERVYKAFLNPDALARWLPPYGFVARIDHVEAKVGGTFKMSFINFGTGKAESFGGQYLELVPNEIIRYTDKFDDPNLSGDIEVTVILKKVLNGTDVHIRQSGLPDVIPVEFCYAGWQQSLAQLTLLVEANIPEPG